VAARASLDNCKEIPYANGVIKSKLTSKSQTTIPLPVRNALHLAVGDELVYAIEGNRVVLSKAIGEPLDDPFATFSEWSSKADTLGYADL